MSAEATVFLVDDDAAVRESMAAIARSKGLKVLEFESAEAFLSYRNAERGCLLVDLRLPGMSGLELQQKLQEAGRAVPTVFISAYGDVPTAVRAMQQGAVTFLEKPCDSADLWAGMELALKQGSLRQLSSESQEALRERFAQLTESEREVLARVVEGQPNKRIAAELDIGLRTVELRRSNIMRKTGANSFSELIRLAIEADFPNERKPTASAD